MHVAQNWQNVEKRLWFLQFLSKLFPLIVSWNILNIFFIFLICGEYVQAKVQIILSSPHIPLSLSIPGVSFFGSEAANFIQIENNIERKLKFSIQSRILVLDAIILVYLLKWASQTLKQLTNYASRILSSLFPLIFLSKHKLAKTNFDLLQITRFWERY